MPSWSRAAPLSHMAMNLGHAIKLEDPAAAEKFFQESGVAWPQDASAVKRWAEGVVPLWPDLATKVARACQPAYRARLWVNLAKSHPDHPVALRLRRSVDAGARILAAVQARTVFLVRAEVNAPTFKKRPPTVRSLQEAMLTAIDTDQADVVKLLLPSVSMTDTRYVNAVIRRPGHPMWPLFAPHLSTSGWYEAAEQAIHCEGKPGKALDVLEEALPHLRDTAHAVWVERLDRLLSSAIWCSSEPAQRVLRSHLGPEDLTPRSLEAARRCGCDALKEAGMLTTHPGRLEL